MLPKAITLSRLAALLLNGLLGRLVELTWGYVEAIARLRLISGVSVGAVVGDSENVFDMMGDRKFKEIGYYKRKKKENECGENGF